MKSSPPIFRNTWLVPMFLLFLAGGFIYTGIFMPATLEQDLAEITQTFQKLNTVNAQITSVFNRISNSIIQTEQPGIKSFTKIETLYSNVIRDELNLNNDPVLSVLPASKKLVDLLNDLRSSQDDLHLILKQPKPDLQKAIITYNEKIFPIYDQLLQQLASINAAKAAQQKGLQETLKYYKFGSWGIVLLIFIIAIIHPLNLRQAVKNKLFIPFQNFTKRLTTQQKIPEDNPYIKPAAIYANKLHQDLYLIEDTLLQLKQQPDGLEELPHRLPDSLLESFLEINTHLKSKKEQIEQLTNLLQKSDQDLKQANKTLDIAIKSHKAQLQALQSGSLVYEINAAGQLTYANDLYLQLCGKTFQALAALDFRTLTSDPDNPEAFYQVWSTVKKGQTWQGLLHGRDAQQQDYWLQTTVVPVLSEAGVIEKFVFTAHNVTEYLLQFKSLQQSISDLQRTNAITAEERNLISTRLEHTTHELDLLKKSIENQKQLEFRLVQQQAALQELTRNNDLRQGNVREALRAITETAVYALDEERAGLWLFTSNNTALRCLDLYERQSMQHSNAYELSPEDLKTLQIDLSKDRVLAVPNLKNSGSSPSISLVRYFQEAAVASFVLAPIHLGGQNIGVLMIEHTSVPRLWTLDEQNFLIAVAEVVSLALEQGNRKALEEELRMTLQEAYHLEEELRQSAEELEAANEELIRNQIELRGQISALNNAAIVTETNLHGRITYANHAFYKTYQLDKTEVLGSTFGLIKSDFHDESYFSELWKTISKGLVWRGEFKNQAKDGTERWVSCTITPVLDNSATPLKYIAVSHDITTQKIQQVQIKHALDIALEQEDMLKDSSFDLQLSSEEIRRTQVELTGQLKALNNSSMVLETNPEGLIVYVNEEFLKTLRYDKEQLLQKPFLTIKGRQPDVVYHELQRTTRNGRIWRGEIELKTADGGFIWTLSTNSPVFNEHGSVTRCITVLFDITVQKQMELRLKRQQTTLLELTNHPAIKEGKFKGAFEAILRAGQDILGSTRGSIWLFVEGGDKLRCEAALDDSNYLYNEGTLLEKNLYTNYLSTLEKDKILAVTDAHNDQRMSELAQSLYVNVPVISVLDVAIRQGTKMVGILSFEFRRGMKQWTLDEQNFVTSLSDTVGVVLESKERKLNLRLKQLYAKLEEQTREVNQQKEEIIRQKAELEETVELNSQSIRYAKRIQNNILPSKELMDKYLGGKEQYFVIHRQKDEVGGDFYWFATKDKRRIVAVADGTGHGVPGAFLTLIGYLLLNQIVNEKGITSPSEILYHLHIGVRQALKQDVEEAELVPGKQISRDGMDVAMVCVDVESYELLYAGANLPLYYYQDWEVHEVKPTKRSIGGEQLEEERTFTEHRIKLKEGDAVYLYTDGFVDQFGGPENKRFSTRRFRDLILRTQHESMITQRALLNMEWKEWKEDREQIDDITVFGWRL